MVEGPGQEWLAVLAGPGWSAFVARAEEAGTTAGVLAADVWNRFVWPELLATLDQCTHALATARAGDGVPLLHALASLGGLRPERDAGAELFVESRFEEALSAAVDGTLGAWFRDSVSASTTPADAARLAYVVAVGLGLWLTARHPRAATADLEAGLRPRIAALQANRDPVDLPRPVAAHMDDAPRLDVDDAVNDAILTATLTLVGSRGLVSTTLADIASEAGVTLADVTVRYASPVRCLEEATFRQNEVGYRLNHDLTLDLERRLGRGGAEAVAIREALQPGRDLGRDMALEQGRSGWRHPEILAAQLAALEAYRSGLLDSETWDARESPTEFYLNVATSLGMYALPRLDPRVAHLPLDVVYIPLYEILQGQG